LSLRTWLAHRLLSERQLRELSLAAFGVPLRSGANSRNLPMITNETALRNSVVWACRRIRADIMSTLPVDSFRKVNGIPVEVPLAPVLVDTDGEDWPLHHWMWAGNWDLDGIGNSVGLVTERNALNLPSRIHLVPMQSVSIYQTKSMETHKYRIDGKEYDRGKVWHERQFPVAGLPVGLSPIAFAAWELQQDLSMQQFALDWFGGGAVPKARLHNTKRSLDSAPKPGQTDNEARRVKDRYNATMANGDVFVHGNDWELDFMQAQTMGTEWIQGREASVPALCRYFGCPVDLVEAAIQSSSSSINYSNAIQRNLQFLIFHLGPAIFRRQESLSRLLPQPRYVRLNTNALLRLDPETQAKIFSARLKDKTITNDEVRAYYEQPPLTQAQIDQFTLLYGGPRTAPDKASAADSEARAFFEQVSPLSAIPFNPTTGVS